MGVGRPRVEGATLERDGEVMNGTVQERLRARKQRKAASYVAAVEYFDRRRRERTTARRAMKLLDRLVGDEHTPLAIARALVPGGVWTAPCGPDTNALYEKHGWPLEGHATLRQIDGQTRMVVRADDSRRIIADGLFWGIAVVLYTALGEYERNQREGLVAIVQESSARSHVIEAICAAVKLHCEARDA